MPLFEYGKSLKSARSDELINTYVVRPLAGILVRALYRTRVTPNQVTATATFMGLVAAALYAQGRTVPTAVAACFLWLKDLLDSADGQLARAKNLFSRMGRFLDSAGDLLVNIAVFSAISVTLFRQLQSPLELLLGAAALLSTTLRISYHVFYQVSYLHLEQSYSVNRTDETLRSSDLLANRTTIVLQRLYQASYGWQDRAMQRLDTWCRGDLAGELNDRWFRDGTGLRLSGLLGMGTEILVLVIFSLCDALAAYLIVNVTARRVPPLPPRACASTATSIRRDDYFLDPRFTSRRTSPSMT